MNFILQVPPYPVEVMVSIGQSDKKLFKCIDKWAVKKKEKKRLKESVKSDFADDVCYGIVHHLQDTGFIILRTDGKIKSAYYRGVLAHEIFHVVEEITTHAGVKHGRKSSEAFAYLTSYLTTEIYKRL